LGGNITLGRQQVSEILKTFKLWLHKVTKSRGERKEEWSPSYFIHLHLDSDLCLKIHTSSHPFRSKPFAYLWKAIGILRGKSVIGVGMGAFILFQGQDHDLEMFVTLVELKHWFLDFVFILRCQKPRGNWRINLSSSIYSVFNYSLKKFTVLNKIQPYMFFWQSFCSEGQKSLVEDLSVFHLLWFSA
jgi:hypothetical protein